MAKYSLGLDIGTNSVGWAVVDENNQLVKKNGITLWGVRMFEEAQDSSGTRSYRTNRRRLARRKYRINLLRDIFREEIDKVDSSFFERLDDSFYKIEDKKNHNVHNLFNDSYTDKEFFGLYPTTYHLRKHLMESEEKEDIRFLYLALHNMIKYRGNFLHKGDVFNKSDDGRIKEIFNELNVLLIEYSNQYEEYQNYFSTIELKEEMFAELRDVLTSDNTKNDKKYKLKELFGLENKTFVVECFIPLLVGSKCDFSKLTVVKDFKYEKAEITAIDEELETKIDEAKSKVTELCDLIDFVEQIKEIVDHFFLLNLLKDSDCLSDAMIKKYDEHKKDLVELKGFIKKYLPNKYNECFRIYNEKINNYPKYVGMNSIESNGIERFAHCTKDDLYIYIKSLLKDINDEEASDIKNKILLKIDNDSFLDRQKSNQNGSLPMQLNLSEMMQILENQEKYYPFLKEKDGDGISNKDKVVSIFKFIIPYYVGPLNSKSDRSWLVRKDEKIYPWNFEKVVDLDSSAVNFIQKMQRKCTYLKGNEDYCLPKNSIIFSKYNCLSYLNKLSIDGALIPNTLKQELFNNVFLKKKKPTRKDIANYIASNYGNVELTTTKLKQLSEVNCDMNSYIKFSEIFNGSIEDKLLLIENIIKDIVIFRDKKILEKRLYNVYNLETEIVKKIKDLNYKDYSNLSLNLLNGLQVSNPDSGEVYGTVIDVMYNTNYNLQEILYNPEYRFIDTIEEYNKEKLVDIEELTVEEFLNENVAVSPIMKRSLVQAYNIISEVKKILKAPIDKYYVECTRTNKAEKKQPSSRYSKIKDLYKSCRKMAQFSGIDFNDLEKKLDQNQNNLKSDLLYLYFTQLGKCMYTLEPIDFDTLMFHNNKYDIDHIYPQSLVKDDSFSNRVLVLKNKNSEKSDNLLFELSKEFLNKNAYGYYEMLYKAELITKEKYNRLTKKELSKGELETFVNRQIVSTNQAVKGLIQVLKLKDGVKTSDIVYSKAENISDVRNWFDFPKSRTANNFHHAHDAYLNVVIGRVINDYFISNHFIGSGDYYRFKAENKTTSIKTLLSKDRYINGRVLWDKEKTIKLINKNLYERYDVSETTRTYVSNELFSKVTILPAGKGNVPIKVTDPRSNVNIYGGITSHKYCKYIIIENVNRKGLTEYILEAIPKAYEYNIDVYLKEQGYSQYKIINDFIKSNVVIENGPLKYCITGKTNESYLLKNLRDRYFEKKYIKIIKKIDKYNENLSIKNIMDSNEQQVIISPARDENCKAIILTKDEMIDLYNELKNKFSKKIYSYSIINSIKSKMDSFEADKFTLQQLVEVCSELLKLLQTNTRKNANLKLISMSVNSGTIKSTNKLPKGMKLISESVTGYYKKVLFEVPR